MEELPAVTLQVFAVILPDAKQTSGQTPVMTHILKVLIPIQAPGVMEPPAIQLRTVPVMHEKAIIGTCPPQDLARHKDANWTTIINHFSK